MTQAAGSTARPGGVVHNARPGLAAESQYSHIIDFVSTAEVWPLSQQIADPNEQKSAPASPLTCHRLLSSEAAVRWRNPQQ
jgi:hypothetical protein